MRALNRTKKIWYDLGESDPLWAIQAHPDKKQNRWHTLDFYQRGINDVRDLLSYLDSFNLNVNTSKCLDFGCGVGRMTIALADHFDEVYAVDISSPMIQLAKKNTCKINCHYQIIHGDDLHIFSDNYFSLIVSYLTLFHIPSKCTKKYLKEFMRILTPGGCAVFHIVSKINKKNLKLFMAVHCSELSRTVCHFLKIDPGIHMYGIYCLPDDDVTRIIEENGGKIIDRVYCKETLGNHFNTIRYCIVKV